MNIALIGYGKMGRMIEEIALSRGHNIVAKIDIDNQDDFSSEAFKSADVAIEFTTPVSAFDNVKRAFAAGVKVVCGSTGWIDKHESEINSLIAQGNTLFWASNFSVGVAIFNAVNKYLAKIMNGFSAYTPEMVEIHHIHKLDAPSGTAITLAEGIIDNIDRLKGWQLGRVQNADGSITPAAPCTADTLRIDAIRLDEVPGIHSVTYESQADCITITHDAHSRRGFALGAVLAAEYTATHSGRLGTADLFDF